MDKPVISLFRSRSKISTTIVLMLLFAFILGVQKNCSALATHQLKRHKLSSSRNHSRSYSSLNTHPLKSHAHSHSYHSGAHPVQALHLNKTHRITQSRPRYAYPMSIFLYHPPTFDSTPFPEDLSFSIRKAFNEGFAGDYPTRSLIKAGIVSYYPIRGGIFWRREPIKYIVMHSTEPGSCVGARTIIDGWSHGGRRHAGAHYVVDRDGTIYQSLDPDLAAVHVNIFKTLPGINNDNSIGIEMCHYGSQDYPSAQLQSVVKLVAYLQSHYHISDNYVITHRYAQQGDHTDPVNFSWDNFIAEKCAVQNQGLNNKLAFLKSDVLNWRQQAEPVVVKTSTDKLVFQTTKTTTKTASTAPNITVNSASTVSTITPKNTSASSNLSSGSTNRLMPATQTAKYIPVSMVINNPKSDGVVFPAVKSNLPTKVLPLKGPIEIDPDTAASLLSQ